MFSVQTTLGTRPDIETKPYFNIRSDQLLKLGESGYPLNNSPKVNHSVAALWLTFGQINKIKTQEVLILYLSSLIHNIVVQSVVCRRFKPIFYKQSPILPSQPLVK